MAAALSVAERLGQVQVPPWSTREQRLALLVRQEAHVVSILAWTHPLVGAFFQTLQVCVGDAGVKAIHEAVELAIQIGLTEDRPSWRPDGAPC